MYLAPEHGQGAEALAIGDGRWETKRDEKKVNAQRIWMEMLFLSVQFIRENIKTMGDSS